MTANLAKEFNTVFGTLDMYRRIIENLHAGIYVADTKGNLVYVNKSFVNILGYVSKDEVIGLNLADHLYVHPEERKEFLKKLEELSFVRDYKVQNKRKDGSIIVLSVTSNMIYGETSEIIGIEGIIHDITEHKKLEKDLVIFKNAIEQTADHVMLTDNKGIIEYVNSSFEKTTGYKKKEVLGKTPKILQSGRQTKKYYEKLWNTILIGKIFHAHTINKKKSGELYVADQTISPILDELGEITHFVSVWKDVTEKIRLEKNLKEEKNKLEEIVGFDEKVSSIRKLDKLYDFVADKTMEILDAQKCSIMLVDNNQGELCIKSAKGFDNDIFTMKIKIGESIAGLVAQEGEPLLVKNIKQYPKFQLAAESSHLGNSFMSVPIMLGEEVIGVINVAEKGNEKYKSFNEVDLKILCSISREVAVSIENLRMYKELHFLTITDSLTGLHNFRHFNQSLDYEIKRVKRLSRPLGLIMIDIDNLKLYNDTFGHPEGNRLLQDIGKILRKNVRDIDIVCRYGGDEFVIILPETKSEEANIVAERLRKSVQTAEFQQTVTISVGVGMYTEKMTRHDLIAKADQALYKAKKEGKNKVCVFD
ncbi:MAG: diguanylate cyclase [Candidatus Omnitrophica bacterium]|nr:diguanylate cyclase [Candidatus Omnitrophota bacterium]